MKLPSMEQAAREASATLKRFPFVLLCGTVAAIAAIVMMENKGDDETFIRVLLPALLGIPLLTALATTMERRAVAAARRTLINVGALVLLVVLYWLSMSWGERILLTRYVHLDVAFHLLAATLPFAGFAAGRAFWHYNRIIFLRFLLATLYVLVLFVGLGVALLALDKLFGLDVDGEWYFRLLVVLTMIVHPWFFLGGMPTDIDALDRRDDYPIGLKIFAQFILIPVVTVYLLILTAYLIKVVVTTTWPRGWIGYLVSSVAAAGTLALLLVHPVRERADSGWVDAYGRWFYVALLPSVAMLLMAIWLRVNQYGTTEPRYFLAILALWLAGIATFYAITGSRNIRLIPVSLCLVALGAFFGPWSAYRISRNSQMGRLRGILERNAMISAGQVVRAPGDVSFDDRREISAVLRYLLDTHGPGSLRSLSAELTVVADSAMHADSPYVRAEPAVVAIADRLGVEYVNRWQSQPEDWISFFANATRVPIALDGYDYMFRLQLTQPGNVIIDRDTIHFEFAAGPPRLTLTRPGTIPFVMPLIEVLDSARAHAGSQDGRPVYPGENGGPSPIIIDREQDGLRLRFRIWSVSGRGTGGAAELNAAEADVLLTLPRPTGGP